MKTFLLTMGAALGMSVIAYASDAVPNQDDLRPADELAQADGLVIDGASGDAALNMDDYRPYPPRPPRPPRPPHYPPPPPHYPPPPPHYPPPPPPYYPPQPRYYECGAEDLYGRSYWGRGQDPRWVQRDVHNACVYQSNGPCRDLGCRSW